MKNPVNSIASFILILLIYKWKINKAIVHIIDNLACRYNFKKSKSYSYVHMYSIFSVHKINFANKEMKK